MSHECFPPTGGHTAPCLNKQCCPHVDRNASGRIVFDKLQNVCFEIHACYSHTHLRCSFDRNGDGRITLDELREGLTRHHKLADSEIEQVGVAGWVGGGGAQLSSV